MYYVKKFSKYKCIVIYIAKRLRFTLKIFSVKYLETKVNYILNHFLFLVLKLVIFLF
jgi:hypothetical protein